MLRDAETKLATGGGEGLSFSSILQCIEISQKREPTRVRNVQVKRKRLLQITSSLQKTVILCRRPPKTLKQNLERTPTPSLYPREQKFRFDRFKISDQTCSMAIETGLDNVKLDDSL